MLDRVGRQLVHAQRQAAAGGLVEREVGPAEGQPRRLGLQERRQRRGDDLMRVHRRVVAGERQVAGRRQGVQPAQKLLLERLDVRVSDARPRALHQRVDDRHQVLEAMARLADHHVLLFAAELAFVHVGQRRDPFLDLAVLVHQRHCAHQVPAPVAARRILEPDFGALHGHVLERRAGRQLDPVVRMDRRQPPRPRIIRPAHADQLRELRMRPLDAAFVVRNGDRRGDGRQQAAIAHAPAPALAEQDAQHERRQRLQSGRRREQPELAAAHEPRRGEQARGIGQHGERGTAEDAGDHQRRKEEQRAPWRAGNPGCHRREHQRGRRDQQARRARQPAVKARHRGGCRSEHAGGKAIPQPCPGLSKYCLHVQKVPGPTAFLELATRHGPRKHQRRFRDAMIA